MARTTTNVAVCAAAGGATAKKSSRALAVAANRQAAVPRERDLVWIGNEGVNCGVMAGSPVALWFFEDNRVETLQRAETMSQQI
jgi:hypothetical protein